MREVFYLKPNKGLPEWSNKREFYDYMLKMDGKKLVAIFERETGVRTLAQNNALHKYFELLANALNDAGLTVQAVLEKKIELDWTPSMVKEILWRDVQARLYGKRSTTQLDKVSEIDNIYDHLTRHLGEKFELEAIPFPHDPLKVT